MRAGSFEARLSAADRAHCDRIAARGARRRPRAAGAREWSERLGLPIEKLRDLLAHLEREGALVRAPGELWFDRAAIDALRERVIAHLREHGRLETPAYKALIGTSRRTAVPLMELFDEQHVTARRGEARILRSGGPSPDPAFAKWRSAADLGEPDQAPTDLPHQSAVEHLRVAGDGFDDPRHRVTPERMRSLPRV